MAGYLLRKAQMEGCETCKQQLRYSTSPSTDLYKFLTNRKHKVENTLWYPTQTFLEFVHNLEHVFLPVFPAKRFISKMSLRLRLRLHTNAEHLQEGYRHCIDPDVITYRSLSHATTRPMQCALTSRYVWRGITKRCQKLVSQMS